MYYRVDVTDGKSKVQGKIYCPGTGIKCSGKIDCTACEGTGVCNHDGTYGTTLNSNGEIAISPIPPLPSTSPVKVGSYLKITCERCGATGFSSHPTYTTNYTFWHASKTDIYSNGGNFNANGYRTDIGGATPRILATNSSDTNSATFWNSVPNLQSEQRK